ncbi:dihydropteroate synthase [Psychrobacter sp. HD31]|uniref:dihydropteroate synthase n=1 Tax=Psychrobacter sp. HD31 TaxID=3112003 RepID=UPI003DA306B1
MKLTTLPAYKITYHDKTLDLSKPHIMGILNVTPDSFSDGGEFVNINNAVNHAKQMIAEGASIIDIGGESTRPNADKVSIEEELHRVLPVIKALREALGKEVWLSIDTSNPEVMQQAVEAGADIVNDVRALKRQGAAEIVSALKVPVILMHMRGEPATMNGLANYDNVMQTIKLELTERINAAVSAGINPQNIIIDAGFGFAKEYAHHCKMLDNFSEFTEMGYPVMFAVSRKRFLGEVLNNSNAPALMAHETKDRDPVGMAAALLAVQQGASIVRTHNVGITKQALSLWEQLAVK